MTSLFSSSSSSSSSAFSEGKRSSKNNNNKNKKRKRPHERKRPHSDCLLVHAWKVDPISLKMRTHARESYLWPIDSVIGILPDISLIKSGLELEALRNFVRLATFEDSEHGVAAELKSERQRGRYWLAREELEDEYDTRAAAYLDMYDEELEPKHRKPQTASNPKFDAKFGDAIKIGNSGTNKWIGVRYDSFGLMPPPTTAAGWDSLLLLAAQDDSPGDATSGNAKSEPQVGILVQPEERHAELFPFWIGRLLCVGYDKDKEQAIADEMSAFKAEQRRRKRAKLENKKASKDGVDPVKMAD